MNSSIYEHLRLYGSLTETMQLKASLRRINASSSNKHQEQTLPQVFHKTPEARTYLTECNQGDHYQIQSLEQIQWKSKFSLNMLLLQERNQVQAENRSIGELRTGSQAAHHSIFSCLRFTQFWAMKLTMERTKKHTMMTTTFSKSHDNSLLLPKTERKRREEFC